MARYMGLYSRKQRILYKWNGCFTLYVEHHRAKMKCKLIVMHTVYIACFASEE